MEMKIVTRFIVFLVAQHYRGENAVMLHEIAQNFIVSIKNIIQTESATSGPVYCQLCPYARFNNVRLTAALLHREVAGAGWPPYFS